MFFVLISPYFMVHYQWKEIQKRTNSIVKNHLLPIGLAVALFLPTYIKAKCDAKEASLACYRIEKDKPNSARQGMSAAEWCAAIGIIQCSS